MPLKKYISLEKTSRHSSFTPETLTEICASGLVEAKKFGRRWFMSEADSQSRLTSGTIATRANSLERFQKFRSALAAIVCLIFLASLIFWF